MSQLTMSASGAIRLSQDLSNLVNNPIGSDIRIEVGGGETSTSGSKSEKSTSSDEKTQKLDTATFHAHSAILRFRSKYFANLYENEWSETTSGVFRKPNISPVVFHSLLYYMYTGSVEVSNVSLLPEVIAAAEEMELEELSLICQSKLINELKKTAENSDNNDSETTDIQNSNDENLSFVLAVRILLIPALVFAYQHILVEFFDELVDFTVDNIRAIMDAKNAFSVFIDKTPVAVFKQILSADSLDLEEYDVWQLALSWGCHRVELLKSIVEAQVRLNANTENYGDDEEIETSSSSNLKEHAEKANQPLVSDDQLKDLRLEIRSLLPTIRFTLMEPDQYLKTVPIFNFFLPSRRLLELQRFFSKPGTPSQEMPRGELNDRKNGIPGSRISKNASEELRRWIYEAQGISGCSSMKGLKFGLLHRASTHGFQASTFHNNCDNKGPTLVLVRSSDNHRFGGVNFVDWTSNGGYSNSSKNFLFALKDGKHRTQSVKFPCTSAGNAANNNSSYGPMFGGGDLYIYNNSNTSQSSSSMPQHYGGSGASNTALAGAQSFTIADYEVFAISKK